MVKLINKAPNFNLVITPNINIFFSYEQPIAFVTRECITYATEKKWSKTSTKHLNSICVNQYLDHEIFIKKLEENLND